MFEIDHVHWERTHTNKYLDFASHNFAQHREAVVKHVLIKTTYCLHVLNQEQILVKQIIFFFQFESE